MDPILKPRETWYVTNISNQSIIITDIPAIPTIKAGQRIDLLAYTSVTILNNSIILRNYINNNNLSFEEYLHTHDDKSYTYHTHVINEITNINSLILDHNILSGISGDAPYYHLDEDSYNKINDITVTASQLNEAGTFFGITDITGEEANNLSDGTNADSLHIHTLDSGIEDLNTTSSEINQVLSGIKNTVTSANLGKLTDKSNADFLHEHLLLTKTDGTRAFTGAVAGIYPTISSHLVTKKYVDDQITSEDFWDREGTDLVTNFTGDNLSLKTGKLFLGSDKEGSFYFDTITGNLIISLDSIGSGSDYNPSVIGLVNIKNNVKIDGCLQFDSGVFVDIIRDEDDMISDDDNALATQQSIKAYIDTQITSEDFWDREGTYLTPKNIGDNLSLKTGKLYLGNNKDSSIYLDSPTGNLIISLDNPSVGGIVNIQDDVNIDGYLNVDDTMIFSSGSIIDTTGTIDFDNENLITAGTINRMELELSAIGSGNFRFGNSTTLASIEAGASDNFAFGVFAGAALTIGDQNVLLGPNSGEALTIQSFNTFIGSQAGRFNAQGGNTAIGYLALRNGISAFANTAVGREALFGLGATSKSHDQCSAFGIEAGTSIDAGLRNTYFGSFSGRNHTDGDDCIFIGAYCGYQHTTQSDIFIIDSPGAARADAATEITHSIIYGIMGANPEDQILNFNAGTFNFGTDADHDIPMNFTTNSNNGLFTWMSTEDYFKFSDDVQMDGYLNVDDYIISGDYIQSTNYMQVTSQIGYFEIGTDVANNRMRIYLTAASGHLNIQNFESNADIFFRYVDGGADQFLKIDASNNGALIHSTGIVTVADALLIFGGKTLTVGSDGNGGDVIFNSSTAGDKFLWDKSERLLQLIDSRFDLDGPDGTVGNAPLAFDVLTGSGGGGGAFGGNASAANLVTGYGGQGDTGGTGGDITITAGSGGHGDANTGGRGGDVFINSGDKGTSTSGSTTDGHIILNQSNGNLVGIGKVPIIALDVSGAIAGSTSIQGGNVTISNNLINCSSGDLTITAAGGDVLFGGMNLTTTGTFRADGGIGVGRDPTELLDIYSGNNSLIQFVFESSQLSKIRLGRSSDDIVGGYIEENRNGNEQLSIVSSFPDSRLRLVIDTTEILGLDKDRINLNKITLLADALHFTQTDGAERIDSDADGMLDLYAGTSINAHADIRLDASKFLIIDKASGNGIKVDTTTPTFGFADLLGRVTSVNTGATKPIHSTYRDGIKEFEFAAGDEDYFEFHIPHDYVLGTDIFLHVHWSHTGAFVTGGTIIFSVEQTYAKSHDQAPFPATVTGTYTGTASTTQYQQILSEIQSSASSPTGLQIDTDDLEPDGVILMTLGINSNDITVSEGGVPNPFIHYVDIHYSTTGLIGTKQKAPDFYS